MIARSAALKGNLSLGEFKLASGNGTSAPKDHVNSLFDNHGSYVLLAACGRDALAFERENRGRFTTALITTLHEVVTDEVTYVDLMAFLPTIEGLRISLISRLPRH